MTQPTINPIEQLVDFEKDVLYQEYPGSQEPECLLIPGNIPILLSAPHGAVHTRDGKDKEEDEYTAGIARLVAARTGAHVIYARRKSRTDPNTDPNAPYKKTLLKIVHENNINFVLDLHGANKDRDFGIALGTIRGQSCTEEERKVILTTFKKHGIAKSGDHLSRLDLDLQFAGAGNDHRETIIKFCHENSIHAAQIEINAWLRIPVRREDASDSDKEFKGDEQLIRNLVEALSDIVALLANGG